jgi:hypothetical protein
METDRMEHVRKVILSTISDGVLKVLAESSLVLIPPVFEDNVFNKAGIDIELPNLSMSIERFVDTDHWWIGDEYYTYYTPKEMDEKLTEEISRSVIWIKIQ